MSITAHRMTGADTGIKERLQMLAPSLAALLYPFALEGFNASVTRIAEGGAGALGLSWVGAAMCIALAFAVPLIAILAAMSLSGIERPTAAQLRAKRIALLAVAAPTLFVFVGVVLTMLHDPVPDTWLWVACWAIALALLLRSDNGVPVVVAPRPVPARLRVGARPRYDLPSAPHRQPPDVPRRRRDVQRSDESVPPRVPQRLPSAAGGRAFPLPGWDGALLRLASYRGAQRPLPHLPDRVRCLPRLLRSGPHGLGLHFCTDISRHRHRMGLRDRRAHRHHQGSVEHPPPTALLARRVLRPRASRGWRSCGLYGAWRQQGVCRPVHDQRYGRSRNHCNMDHAWYERNACPFRLNLGCTHHNGRVRSWTTLPRLEQRRGGDHDTSRNCAGSWCCRRLRHSCHLYSVRHRLYGAEHQAESVPSYE